MRTTIILATLAIFMASCQQAQAPTGTAIRNVTVIDAINGVRENRTVVFDGDAITGVHSADAELSVAESIDGSGKYLLPGLWDFHVHLTFDDRFGDTMPGLFLSYGVTSVRDTGGQLSKVLPVVEKMRAADAVSPRVYFAGNWLAQCNAGRSQGDRCRSEKSGRQLHQDLRNGYTDCFRGNG